ncbi:MAG: hypothetical protein CMJ94_15655 [Planctomycetes bacterium]|nr:hypothetical protein [Planctomycetota bacterium]
MAARPPRPGLAELIDLETGLLQLDGLRPAAAAAGRELLDRDDADPVQARLRAETDADWRWQLAAAWLQRLRSSGVALPGRACQRSLTTAARIAQGLGILLGAGAASATLTYDGSAPVNLWNFLGLFVLLQILLFALLLFTLGAGAARGRALTSATQRAVGALARAPIVRRLLGTAPESWRASWEELARHRTALATRRPLYAEAERWGLFRSAQAIGVGFHLAAAVVFLWLAVFSDLAFAWSTTPAGVDASWLHGLVQALAWPWAWLAPETVPSLEEVAATQWNRLDRSFVQGEGAASARASAAWWSFLLVAQLVWGLLPRLLAWAYGGWRLRRALQASRLDHTGFQRLFDLMLALPKPGDWQGPRPSEVQGELLAESAPAGAAGASADDSAAGFAIPARPVPALVWGGFPHQAEQLAARLRQGFSWTAESLLEAGGADAHASETAVRQAAEQAKRAQGLVLFAELGESPNKALTRALQKLRETLGVHAPILVALVGPEDEAALQLWRDYLARLHDPYLRVEALG